MCNDRSLTLDIRCYVMAPLLTAKWGTHYHSVVVIRTQTSRNNGARHLSNNEVSFLARFSYIKNDFWSRSSSFPCSLPFLSKHLEMRN